MHDFELVREATTPAEMRAEISRMRLHSPVVANTMAAADCSGVSAEDRYTMLAYHALASLAHTKNALLEHMGMVPPSILIRCDKCGGDPRSCWELNCAEKQTSAGK